MPITAIRIFSPTNGFLSEEIRAREIKGREDARKLAPFCNASHTDLMLWVNWGTRKNGQRLRPYFRRYTEKKETKKYLREIIEEEFETVSKRRSTTIHERIQDCLVEAINLLIKDKKPIYWSFDDPRLSDFPLSGNLLSGVIKAEKEYDIRPPFCDKVYRLDIALLGERISRKAILLGAIEIEYTHEAEVLKTLLCKSCGFPLFTLDVKDASEQDITVEWCMQRLLETKASSGDLRRRNYIYLHNMLYPVFLSKYKEWGLGEKHHYLVFINAGDQPKLLELLEKLCHCLKLSKQDADIIVHNLNPNDKGCITLFENEGAIAGPDWREYNSKSFIRIVLKRPQDKQGAIYNFHLVLTQLLTLYFDCLVGYKIESGRTHCDKENPLWLVQRTERVSENPPQYVTHTKRFCPKRVSEPVRKIIELMPRKI